MTRLVLITGLAATAYVVGRASTADADADTPSDTGFSPDSGDGNLKWIDRSGQHRELIWELLGAGGGGPSLELPAAWCYGSRN